LGPGDPVSTPLLKGESGKQNRARAAMRDLRMWSSMISSRIISFQKLMLKSCQVLHPFLTLYYDMFGNGLLQLFGYKIRVDMQDYHGTSSRDPSVTV